MAKYLVAGSYTAQGAKGVAHEGATARRAAVQKLLESVGGKLESMYFAFGEVDVYITIDLPDNVTAAAVALTVAQTGMVTTKVIVLLSVEEMDAATKKSVAYRPPGS